MDREPVRQEVFQVLINDLISFMLEDFSGTCVALEDLLNGLEFQSFISYISCGFCGFLARMHKYKHLVIRGLLDDLGIADIVHRLQLLDSFFVCDTNEFLLEGARPEGRIEMK
jgi:hypothetical protein